jgi:hypothetical protein
MAAPAIFPLPNTDLSPQKRRRGFYFACLERCEVGWADLRLDAPVPYAVFFVVAILESQALVVLEKAVALSDRAITPLPTTRITKKIFE